MTYFITFDLAKNPSYRKSRSSTKTTDGDFQHVVLILKCGSIYYTIIVIHTEENTTNKKMNISTTVTDVNGALVITQVIPQNAESPVSSNLLRMQQSLKAFLKGEPKALGAVQIMIAVLSISFGALLGLTGSMAFIGGIPFWPSILYIISGSLSVAATKKPTPCLMKGALSMNIISAIFTILGICMYSLDIPFYYGLMECDGSNCVPALIQHRPPRKRSLKSVVITGHREDGLAKKRRTWASQSSCSSLHLSGAKGHVILILTNIFNKQKK
ncbi:uncharacterized protein LOC120527772 isoform X2 [Polypterus senegalus]|uniref:uncharacterized protein LOC120527772 isoform X2 n=1 Tax=Polypterus senegalus TaxID=55291 RepID=UPI0019624F18|nr:uncharacterized protein LOC120527772 isoform X2 [Polypterus senegalus]